VQEDIGGDGGAVEIGRGRRKLSTGEVISGGVVYLSQWQQQREKIIDLCGRDFRSAEYLMA